MKIKDIMTTDVVSVSPDTSIANVVEIISRNGFHGLPVVEGKKVIGIITEDDFFLKNYDDLYLPSYIRFIKENKIAGSLPADIKEKIGKLLSAKAKDLMTTAPITVSPEMETPELMELIKKTRFITFPVVDEVKSIVGIVTLADILGTVKHGSGEMKRAMRGEKEIEGLAKELDTYWKDEFVFISKKKVKTWKGVAFIGLIAVIGVAILLIANLKLRQSYTEQANYYPLECQRFTYSDWSPCNDGIQTRQVIQKLPQGCQGGYPDMARSCQ